MGADKHFAAQGCVADGQALNVTPRLAQSTTNRRLGIDGRTTRYPGYGLIQRARKRFEDEGFAWTWTQEVELLRRHRGQARINWAFALAAAFNLIWPPELLGAGA